jgi:DNA modification methylase
LGKGFVHKLSVIIFSDLRFQKFFVYVSFIFFYFIVSIFLNRKVNESLIIFAIININIRKDVLLPCTEHIYWLTKSKPKVFKENIPKEYQSEVWTINPDRNSKHPAPFPQKLVENCILLTTEENDIILDPFLGSGTSAIVSKRLNRGYLGIEIDEKYMKLSKELLENYDK